MFSFVGTARKFKIAKPSIKTILILLFTMQNSTEPKLNASLSFLLFYLKSKALVICKFSTNRFVTCTIEIIIECVLPCFLREMRNLH